MLCLSGFELSGFEMLENELLPYKSVELNLEIEFHGNLIWQDADKCK